VHKESRELPVQLVLSVQRGRREFKAFKVFKAKLAQQVHRAFKE
jgi:hypothetical protein